MGEHQNKIFIIIPTFNRAKFLTNTLNSITSQTYSNWECLIIDDGSTDETKLTIESFQGLDSRFQYFLRTSKYKKGAAGSRNYGLDIARDRNAQYIQFFDDDDIMYPEKLEKQIIPLVKDTSLAFSVCKFDKLDEMKSGESSYNRPEFNLKFSHAGDSILTGELKINTLSTLWNMHVLDQFRFDERLAHAEEWELFTRIGYNYPNSYAIVNDYLYAYRKHSESLTMGVDLDFKKRKSSTISRVILFEYLFKNNLHTKRSLMFFTKTFLFRFYDAFLIKRIIDYIKINQNTFGKLFLLKIIMVKNIWVLNNRIAGFILHKF